MMRMLDKCLLGISTPRVFTSSTRRLFVGGFWKDGFGHGYGQTLAVAWRVCPPGLKQEDHLNSMQCAALSHSDRRQSCVATLRALLPFVGVEAY